LVNTTRGNVESYIKYQTISREPKKKKKLNNVWFGDVANRGFLKIVIAKASVAIYYHHKQKTQ